MKERQRQMREDAILDAAVEFIRTKGLNAMTLEHITESIGISRPTLYQHFNSKEDLVMHLALRNIRQAREVLCGEKCGLPASDRIRHFIRWVCAKRFSSDMMPFYDLTRIIMSESSAPIRDAERALIADLEALITSGQGDGAIRNDIRAVLLAETILGVVKNLCVDSLVAEGVTDSDEIGDSILKLITSVGQ